ncbi:hypothetical protein ACT7DB_30770 [Bacillus cereus]
MSKKQAFLKKVTIVSGTVLVLSSLTGCFGKEEASSKEKGKKENRRSKKKRRSLRRKRRSQRKRRREKKESHPTDENVMHVSAKKRIFTYLYHDSEKIFNRR